MKIVCEVLIIGNGYNPFQSPDGIRREIRDPREIIRRFEWAMHLPESNDLFRIGVVDARNLKEGFGCHFIQVQRIVIEPLQILEGTVFLLLLFANACFDPILCVKLRRCVSGRDKKDGCNKSGMETRCSTLHVTTLLRRR
jgi:hypothetical protein